MIGFAVTLIKGESSGVEESGLLKLFLFLGRLWPNKGEFALDVDINPKDFVFV